jgi:hypothetical protein
MRENCVTIVARVRSSQLPCCGRLVRNHLDYHGLRIQATNERRAGKGGGHVRV